MTAMIMNKMTQDIPKKKKKYLVIGLIVLVLLIGGFTNYKYLQNATRTQYVQGGNDAINQIVEAAKLSGGVTLEISDNESIILARYNKAITPPIIDNTNYTIPQITTPPVITNITGNSS